MTLTRDNWVTIILGVGLLASIGTRTALEHLMVEKIGNKGAFKDKVERFYSGGFIDKEEKGLL
jgi:hypothetical protein